MDIRTKEDVLQAMELTSQLAESIEYLPNDQLLLSLVTEESLVNALEYCTKLGEIIIRIHWRISRNCFEMSVKQKGTVFNLEKKDEMNYGPRGRGIQLILNIMDAVEIKVEDEESIVLYMRKSRPHCELDCGLT